MTVRIMIVDDDELVLQALHRVLRTKRPDWLIEPTNSGAEALSRIEVAPPDLVVLDNQMPKMNGIDLARAIRSKRPSLCCIMLTGFADLETAMGALNEGNVFRFFQKPCQIDQLVAGIEAGLEKRGQTRGTGKSFDHLPFGALLIDAEGRILHRNPAASRLLSAVDGLRIDASGKLLGGRAGDSSVLRDAAREALKHDRAVALPLHRKEGLPLAAAVSVADRQEGLLVVFLTDPEAPPSPSSEAVANIFGLTPAEARLVAALARGRTLEAAAGEQGITLASARTYLKTVFSKMGVTRQADLVRQVVGSAAVSAAG